MQIGGKEVSEKEYNEKLDEVIQDESIKQSTVEAIERAKNSSQYIEEDKKKTHIPDKQDIPTSIKCCKCGTMKGCSKDRYLKLLQQGMIDSYVCKDCRE